MLEPLELELEFPSEEPEALDAQLMRSEETRQAKLHNARTGTYCIRWRRSLSCLQRLRLHLNHR